jgi:CHASE2 domain-containing sensor protein
MPLLNRGAWGLIGWVISWPWDDDSPYFSFWIVQVTHICSCGIGCAEFGISLYFSPAVTVTLTLTLNNVEIDGKRDAGAVRNREAREEGVV